MAWGRARRGEGEASPTRLDNWDRSWIIRPVAGVLPAAVMGIVQLVGKRREGL